MIAFSILLAIAGFLALCLAMPRHQRDLFGAALSSRVSALLNAAGWASLALSAIWSFHVEGAAMGAVYVAGTFTLSATIIALAVTHVGRK